MTRTKTLAEFVRETAVEMDSMQRRLIQFGLHGTAAAINQASVKIGYDAAQKMERDQKKGGQP